MPRLLACLLALVLPIQGLSAADLPAPLQRLAESRGNFEFCEVGSLCETPLLCLTLEQGQLWLQGVPAGPQQWRSRWVQDNETRELELQDRDINRWLTQWVERRYDATQQRALKAHRQAPHTRNDLIALTLLQGVEGAHQCQKP